MSGRAAGILITIGGAVLGIYMVIMLDGYFRDMRLLVILVYFNVLENPGVNNILILLVYLMLFNPPELLGFYYNVMIYVSLGICGLGTVVAALSE
jgi:hypothetical protein